MIQGFKDFILRGNVLDLAVGVIIGAAFGTIVDSIVADLVNPLIGTLMGGATPDFSALKVGSLSVGKFINTLIAFLLKAAAVYFFIVVPAAKLFPKPAAAPTGPTTSEKLLGEIRDALTRGKAAGA